AAAQPTELRIDSFGSCVNNTIEVVVRARDSSLYSFEFAPATAIATSTRSTKLRGRLEPGRKGLKNVVRVSRGHAGRGRSVCDGPSRGQGEPDHVCGAGRRRQVLGPGDPGPPGRGKRRPRIARLDH